MGGEKDRPQIRQRLVMSWHVQGVVQRLRQEVQGDAKGDAKGDAQSEVRRWIRRVPSTQCKHLWYGRPLGHSQGLLKAVPSGLGETSAMPNIAKSSSSHVRSTSVHVGASATSVHVGASASASIAQNKMDSIFQKPHELQNTNASATSFEQEHTMEAASTTNYPVFDAAQRSKPPADPSKPPAQGQSTASA